MRFRCLRRGLFLVAIMAVIRGYFQGLGSMMPTAVSQIIEQLIRAVVSIVGAGLFVDIGTRAGEKSRRGTSRSRVRRGRGNPRDCAGRPDRPDLPDFCRMGVQRADEQTVSDRPLREGGQATAIF